MNSPPLYISLHTSVGLSIQSWTHLPFTSLHTHLWRHVIEVHVVIYEMLRQEPDPGVELEFRCVATQSHPLHSWKDRQDKVLIVP